jgi:hypothetical protein
VVEGERLLMASRRFWMDLPSRIERSFVFLPAGMER